MSNKDRRVDAYIAKSPEFAQPILKQIRKLVHAAVPEVEETMKWNVPHFVYHGNICGMAAFKQHCRLILWKAPLILPKGMAEQKTMNQFGRINSLADLPSDTKLKGYFQKAARLNQAGVKVTRAKTKDRPPLEIPAYLTAALKQNKRASVAFQKFSYSHQKDYVMWLAEAKAEETRQRRLQTALEWLAEGKPRNWKYIKR